MPKRSVNILWSSALLILVVAICVYTVCFSGHYGTNANNSTALLSSVKLESLCDCQLILSDEASVSLFDPATNTSTATFAPTSNGADNSPSLAGISPSGQNTLLFDYPHHQLLLADSTTGKTLRTLSLESNRFVSSWSWSPDETTLLLVTGRQQTDGTLLDDSTEVVRWRQEDHTVMPNLSSRPSGQLVSLMSTNNDGSQVIIGWSTGQDIQLFSIMDGSTFSNILLPPMSLDPRNSNAVLSAVSHGHALLAVGQTIFSIDIPSNSVTPLISDAQVLFQLSPISQDGESILVVHRKAGTAHNQITRYIPSLNTTVGIVPRFDVGDGFQKATWVPGGPFLAFYNSYDHTWNVVDSRSDIDRPLQRLTIPNLQTPENVVGFSLR